jgi:hypothetical protein
MAERAGPFDVGQSEGARRVPHARDHALQGVEQVGIACDLTREVDRLRRLGAQHLADLEVEPRLVGERVGWRRRGHGARRS